MAINSDNTVYDTKTPKSQCYTGYNSPVSRLVKIDFSTEGSIKSSIGKQGKYKKNVDFKSPYLAGDKALSTFTVTEKMIGQKTAAKIGISSFPLAVNLYKGSLAEVKATKNKKKVKKSVLTLPTDHAPVPQLCTVSDMNDSEYYTRNCDNSKQNKKRNTAAARKFRGRSKGIEIYDRDAQYCSHLNIDLDCSSTDIMKKYNGDKKLSSKAMLSDCKEKVNPHDVWAVLRNINRFKFDRSPPISEDSFEEKKKKKCPKRRNNRKGNMRMIETCREEFAYISSYELDSKSPHSFSQNSSFDRITVINKKDDKICKESAQPIMKTSKNIKNVNDRNGKPLNRIKGQNNDAKAVKPRDHNYIKRINKCENFCGDSTIVSCQNNNLKENNQIIKKCDSIDTITQGIKNIGCHDSTQKSPYGDEFSYSSIYSGSSKALLSRKGNDKKDDKKPKLVNGHIPDGSKERSGVTRIVLNKGGQLDKPRQLKNNPTEIAFTPNNFMAKPKLTKIELRRGLSKVKFPITVLGKDQITNAAFEVGNDDQPQFNGLDKQIWPYMREWYGFSDKTSKTKGRFEGNNKLNDEDAEKRLFLKNIPNSDKLLKTKYMKKTSNHFRHKNRLFDKRVLSSRVVNQVQETTKLTQQADQMVKLLYKNSAAHSVVSGSSQLGGFDAFSHNIINMKPETCTWNKKYSRPLVTTSKLQQYNIISEEKRRWSKSQTTNEFIDNILGNMQNGLYYMSKNNADNNNNNLGLEDFEHQTVQLKSNSNIDPTIQSISKVAIKKNLESLHPIPIPGFNRSLPALEIKTMNANEIAIKHCITNIMVRFDVTMPAESTVPMNRSNTLIPIDTNDSHTKMFKCQTSILNAALPAELCSLLPKMIQNLAKSYHQNDYKLAPKPIMNDQPDNELFTIPEVPRESTEVFKFVLLPHINDEAMSPEIIRILNGRYFNADKIFLNILILGKSRLSVKYDSRLVEELIPRLSRRNLLKCDFDPTIALLDTAFENSKKMFEAKHVNTCKALIPYIAPDPRLAVVKSVNYLSPLVDNIDVINLDLNGAYSFTYNSTIPINVTVTHLLKDEIIRICSGKFVMEIPSKTYINATRTVNAQVKCIQYLGSSSSDIKNIIHNKRHIKFYVIKKKGVMTIKKNKSCQNRGIKRMSLNKITSLQKFCQVLNLEKIPNVFDNCSSNKIMSCIVEMKNWITEINPNQAFLVLLLTFRKETPNLARYRPVLLHGISVNRITRVNELEMEIEVIEREQLNISPQCEGISYLPASLENRDSLYEELYWIAKTTASDYQLPFDESSEKHLKSLLEKRKMLNPSYLRVMARYVGLGLLKPLGKK